ncbi:uncharacterized protein LOC110712091 [Chenopodium quinoa]|uniref:uncharacterized protein LOC110712091 n=1 Tax=Chenopodium quinoa TaxID=63459 RepID=UPI000B79390F|nr:uncharacterized protein LOC110712091 [Chenopodium quinoa]
MQSLDSPGWKWDCISMDFVTCLPKSKSGNDTIWVVVDKLTKSAVFIQMKETWEMEQLEKAYIKNVVRLHGFPKDIVSDRDSRFLSSYHASIGMTPFEALYGRKCRSPICWNDISETMILGPQMIENTVKKVREIQAAQDLQKCYADLKRREEEFAVGDKVLLKVSPMKGVMRFGKKGKLSPKYISPYELRRYILDKSHVLQPETKKLDQSLTYEERPVKILDSKVRSTRNKEVKIVKVLWSNQEYEEATWEAEDEMKNKYPELFKVW